MHSTTNNRKNRWIGNFFVNDNVSVGIGDNCYITPEVAFQIGVHLIGLAECRARTGINNSIKVGNGTWIGTSSTIVNNVCIGNSCVVVACVASDLPNNCLVG